MAARLLVVTALFFFFAAAFPLASAAKPSTPPVCDSQGPRKDCGYVGIDRKACERKGCCWSPLREHFDETLPPIDADTHAGPTLSLPACFHANAALPAFELENGGKLQRMSEAEGNNASSSSSSAFLGRAGGPLNPSSTLVGVAKLKKGVQPELGPDFSRVRVAVDDKGLGPGVLRIKLTDADDPRRWEVPPTLLDESAGVGEGGGRSEDDDDDGVGKASSPSLSPPLLQATVDKNLNIKVTRTSSSSSPSSSSSSSSSLPLFDTSGLRLVLKDQYLELSTRVAPDSALFGLGERISSTGLALRRSGRPLALWNRDCTDYPDLNLYGSFPFAMELRRDGSAHGFLLWNSNAMDAVLTTDSRLSFRTTGGVADLYVLAGPTPAAVVEQLTRLVGRPAMPPLWALGFHQSKYGYKDVKELEGVSEGYTRAKIPLDAVWGDIDYMDRWKDFTFDPVNYPEKAVRAFVDSLHNQGRRFVPILDPGIKLEPGYAPYDNAVAQGLFLKDVTGDFYIGEVWPGACHFPDFLNPASLDWWAKHVGEFYEKVPFDGLWIDMNEASNFCTGHVCEVPPEGINLDYLSPGAGAKPYFEFGLEPPRCALQCWSLEPFLKQWLLQEQLQGNNNADGKDGGNGAGGGAAEVGGGDSRKAAADAAAAAAAAAAAKGENGDNGDGDDNSGGASPSPNSTSSSSSSNSSAPSPTANGVGGALGALVKHVVAGRGGAIRLASRAWQETGMSRAEWQRLMKADAPPYAVANNNVRLPLSFRTLPTTARHFDGTLQYDAHNLYGLSQAAVTARALRRVFAAAKEKKTEESGGAAAAPASASASAKKKRTSFFSSLLSPSSSSSSPASSSSSSSSHHRSHHRSYSQRPFILTRSSFLGAGAHSAHWLGDNAATWEDLRWSVTGVLESGLYGNPLPGADVCGFLFDATPELCARWIAAGSFHPFVRDHSDLMAANQELFRWPETVRAARRALGARYRLLPYFYSGSAAAARRGCPLARPLWFGWPSERAAVGSVASGEQWLVGDGLLVSPAMRPNATEVEAYFPPGAWFDFWTGAKVREYHEGGKRRPREDGDGGAGGDGSSSSSSSSSLSSSVLDDRLGDDTASNGNGGNGNGGGGGAVAGEILARTSTLQAPLDHVPLHLAGGIALLSAAGGEAFVPLTTGEAWRAPLEATVALPDVDGKSSSLGGTFARCGAGTGPSRGSPHAPPVGNSRVAWGRSFRDGERGDDADAFAEGSWALVSGWEEEGGGGGVRITLSRSGNGWDGGKGKRGSIDNCSGGPWPALADVRVLGVEAEPDAASFELSSFTFSSSLSSSSSSSSTVSLKPKQVSFDAASGVLFVRGLNAKLECGAGGEAAGVELRWKAKKGGESFSSSSKNEL